ncbi:MAG: helix-turn-helix domain-containing protein [Candidatus Sericytochromatia bacterium]
MLKEWRKMTMSNCHPKELRERVVEAYDNGEGSQRELAERFKISYKAVNSWIRLARETGSVEPARGSGGTPSEITLEALESILAVRNDFSYEEIAERLEAENIAASKSSVHRAMVRYGITRKKSLSVTGNKPNMPKVAKHSKRQRVKHPRAVML